ncbi:MAG: hypothetical protein HY553_18090 [Elusimicrobia bacterium]|nr:hypothetical protein [Elusimicrobiota bacterium]
MSSPLPAETRTLYAELLERLLAEGARRSVGRAPGTFTTKAVKGERYAYFQYSEPGGKVRQLYLGRQGDALESLAARFKSERPEFERERADLERLCAQISVGGGWSMGPRASRVLKAFADAGVFDAGAVLIGTHAFGLIGNLLGLRLAGASLRTDDVDLAAVSLLASSGGRADAEAALDRLEMGFLPVPSLDPRRPSTSFKVRGQSLRVDFLTPGSGEKPVPLPGLGTHGQPLPFMEYLIENPDKAAVIDAGGFVVNVPSPARFALHKLIVAGERPISQETKARKDLAQAAQLLEALAESRPGELRLANDAIGSRGWSKRLERGLRRALDRHPESAPAARLLR